MIKLLENIDNTDKVIQFASTTTGFVYFCRVDGLDRMDDKGNFEEIKTPYEFTIRGCKNKEAAKWKVYRAVRKAEADYINNIIKGEKEQ